MQLTAKRRKTLAAEMNVVPFIDVMLVLLVIFMITTPLLTQGVKVNLPETKAAAIDTLQREPLIVSINEKGDIYFNMANKPNQAISMQTLIYLAGNLLKDANRSSQNSRPVLIKGDKNINYGTVIEVMSQLQMAGAKNIGLITKEPLKKGE